MTGKFCFFILEALFLYSWSFIPLLENSFVSFRVDRTCSGSQSLEPTLVVSHGGKLVIEKDENSNGGFGADEARPLNHCGLLPNTCLPCLASTVLSVDKRRSLSPHTPGSRKKAPSRLSFKFSPKVLLQRPLAGSSVPYCRLEKKMLDSWSRIEPNTFKVRGRNYFRTSSYRCIRRNPLYSCRKSSDTIASCHNLSK